MLNYKNNYLYYENVNLNSLAKQYHTPAYVYSKTKIIENCNNYHQAFKNNKLTYLINISNKILAFY